MLDRLSKRRFLTLNYTCSTVTTSNLLHCRLDGNVTTKCCPQGKAIGKYCFSVSCKAFDIQGLGLMAVYQ